MTKSSIILVWAGAAALTFGGLSSVLFAQDQGEVIRVIDRGDADKATAPLRVRMPDPSGAVIPVPEEETLVPPPEPEVPPPTEEPKDEPPAEDEDAPTFFGETVKGNFVWVLDRSGSMGASDSGSGPIEDWNGNVLAKPGRFTLVKSECVKVLRQLKEDDKFGIVWFSTGVSAYKGDLEEATPDNINKAVDHVIKKPLGMYTNMGGGLHRGCKFGPEVHKLFLLGDGGPSAGLMWPQILQKFPQWYQPLKEFGCKFIVIHVGSSGGSLQQNMQNLANQNAGEYIAK